jgi:hypothetical protein
MASDSRRSGGHWEYRDGILGSCYSDVASRRCICELLHLLSDFRRYVDVGNGKSDSEYNLRLFVHYYWKEWTQSMEDIAIGEGNNCRKSS